MPKKIKTSRKWSDSSNKKKISEALKIYASPLLEEAQDINSVKAAIVLASLCWNIALMPQDKQEELMHETVAKISEIIGDYETSKKIMEMMIGRKKIFFPEYTKLIVSYGIVPLDNGRYSLSVVSAEINK